jgi:hypothetical protein
VRCEARRTSALRHATYLGLATGLSYGMTAGLLKACTEKLRTHPFGLLTGWQLYALAGIGAAGFVLSQNAFQDRLAAPLIAITFADPVLSVVIGLTVFRERMATNGPRMIVLAIAAAAVTVGTGLAATGPSARDRDSGVGSAGVGSAPPGPPDAAAAPSPARPTSSRDSPSPITDQGGFHQK